MCGRFVSASPPDEIARYFDAELGERLEASAHEVREHEVREHKVREHKGSGGEAEAEQTANYNVAPTNEIYVVLESGDTRQLDMMRWGLVPFWAKDPSIGAKMINARAETIASKNAFKRSLEKRRCLIPADGFYEWKKIPGQKTKQPMYIHRADGDRFAFAGLWEIWRNPDRPDDEPLRTCTIITGEANEAVADVHDRMPVMLPPDKWDQWLDPQVRDVALVSKLLVPAPASIIAMHPVSTDVNRVSNNGPSLIEPVDPTHVPGSGQATLL